MKSPPDERDTLNAISVCRQNFQQWKKIYDEKMDAKFSRNQDTRIASLLSPSEQMRKAAYEDQTMQRYQHHKKLFDDSQYIEVDGEPHFCEPNGSRMNCNFVSKAQFKCACQKYYTGRKHLNCSCDPSGFLLLEGLTEDRCRRNGYLDDDFPKLADRMQVSQDGVTTAAASAGIAMPHEERMASTGDFPVHSCPACAPEFKALETDWTEKREFSWEHLRQLNGCIDNLSERQISSESLQWNAPQQPLPIDIDSQKRRDQEPHPPPCVRNIPPRAVSLESADDGECSCTGTSTSVLERRGIRKQEQPQPQPQQQQQSPVQRQVTPRIIERIIIKEKPQEPRHHRSPSSLSTPSASSYSPPKIAKRGGKFNQTDNSEILVARVSQAIRDGFAILEKSEKKEIVVVQEEKPAVPAVPTTPPPTISETPKQQSSLPATGKNFPPIFILTWCKGALERKKEPRP